METQDMNGTADLQSEAERKKTIMRDIYLKQLEQTYENLRTIYTVAAQWAAIIAATWAALVAFGLAKDQQGNQSGILVIIAGFALLLLVYEIHRVGKTSGALAVIALNLGKKLDLGFSESITVGFLLGLRGFQRTSQMIEIGHQEWNDADWLQFMRKPSRYTVFNVGLSKTTAFLTSVAIMQIVGGTVVVCLGWLPLW